ILAILFFLYLFFFYCYGDHLDLHSFPTRRSSDLLNYGRLRWCRLRLLPSLIGQAFYIHSRSSRILRAARPAIPRSWDRRPCRSRSEEHTSELQSPYDLVCRLLLEKKKRLRQQPSR